MTCTDTGNWRSELVYVRWSVINGELVYKKTELILITGKQLFEVRCKVSVSQFISCLVTSVVVMDALPMGPKPARVCCPVCHVHVKTTTVSENKATAHVACIVLFLLG